MVQHTPNGTANGTTRLSITPQPGPSYTGQFGVRNSHVFQMDKTLALVHSIN